jgi:hypothetical protein
MRPTRQMQSRTKQHLTGLGASRTVKQSVVQGRQRLTPYIYHEYCEAVAKESLSMVGDIGPQAV